MKTSKKQSLNFWAIKCKSEDGLDGYAFRNTDGNLLACYVKGRKDATPELFLNKEEAEDALKDQKNKNKKLTDRKLKSIFYKVHENKYSKPVRVKLFLN